MRPKIVSPQVKRIVLSTPREIRGLIDKADSVDDTISSERINMTASEGRIVWIWLHEKGRKKTPKYKS